MGKCSFWEVENEEKIVQMDMEKIIPKGLKY